MSVSLYIYFEWKPHAVANMEKNCIPMFLQFMQVEMEKLRRGVFRL